MSGSLLSYMPDLLNYLGCKSKLKVIINTYDSNEESKVQKDMHTMIHTIKLALKRLVT